MKLKDKLKELVELFEIIGEKQVLNKLTNIIYDEYGENTLNLFLTIQQLDIQQVKIKQQELYRGMEFAMHSSSAMGRHLLEDKTSRQAKEYAKYVFTPKDANIASIIYTCKAYFIDGKSNGASNNGKWYFDKLIEILKTNKKDYLKGGKSYDWAINNDVADYIELVIKENKL